MMTSKELIAAIECILKKEFSPVHLNIIDESDQHIGHTSHGGAKHLFIGIQSEKLCKLTRVMAHRMIYDALKNLIPKEIHALRISVGSK